MPASQEGSDDHGGARTPDNAGRPGLPKIGANPACDESRQGDQQGEPLSSNASFFLVGYLINLFGRK